jgi:hypothetical protein
MFADESGRLLNVPSVETLEKAIREYQDTPGIST